MSLHSMGICGSESWHLVSDNPNTGALEWVANMEKYTAFVFGTEAVDRHQKTKMMYSMQINMEPQNHWAVDVVEENGLPVNSQVPWWKRVEGRSEEDMTCGPQVRPRGAPVCSRVGFEMPYIRMGTLGQSREVTSVRVVRIDRVQVF